MERPKIALSGSIIDNDMAAVNEKYIEAIWSGGGAPTLLAPFNDGEYLSFAACYYDGFVFCGGDDIDPKYYGEERSVSLGNICSKRDEFENNLFNKVSATGKPILGICRGMQVINVFSGGNLHQHIEGHKQQEKKHVRTHCVSIIKDSMLEKIVGSGEITVNSFHHQVIKDIADNLQVDAVSPDGFIEACHREGHKFLLCVQWHPEAYYDLSDCSKRIFDTFIEACK